MRDLAFQLSRVKELQSSQSPPAADGCEGSGKAGAHGPGDPVPSRLFDEVEDVLNP